MSLKELGVTVEMINGIAEKTLIMDGGYKKLSKGESVDILKKVCNYSRVCSLFYATQILT